ncbi:hypothetical protein [Zhaonella formicivorans]|jgi:hypothetical protein|uniref:hypothetical protein n=1 Tax=Zhaonella formicivorans TaxID=2528593 RepID=UPI0010EC6432|nr:hypothetical protein [Zhaonella formicivorans]
MDMTGSEKEVLARVVAEIRRRSAENIALTPLEAFKEEPFYLEDDALANIVYELAQAEEYEDIQFLTFKPGAKMYLYSSLYISDSYARALLRKEQQDPCFLIAETVREESRVYPRPTCSDTLALPPYNLDLSELTRYLDELKSREEFGDIHWFKTSTDVIYLYSDKYMSKDYASYLAEWYEVGQYENQ